MRSAAADFCVAGLLAGAAAGVCDGFLAPSPPAIAAWVYAGRSFSRQVGSMLDFGGDTSDFARFQSASILWQPSQYTPSSASSGGGSGESSANFCSTSSSRSMRASISDLAAASQILFLVRYFSYSVMGSRAFQ